MMSRGLFILLLIVAAIFWLAFRVRAQNQTLSTALFTLAIAVSLLIIGGFFGWIGG